LAARGPILEGHIACPEMPARRPRARIDRRKAGPPPDTRAMTRQPLIVGHLHHCVDQLLWRGAWHDRGSVGKCQSASLDARGGRRRRCGASSKVYGYRALCQIGASGSGPLRTDRIPARREAHRQPMEMISFHVISRIHQQETAIRHAGPAAAAGRGAERRVNSARYFLRLTHRAGLLVL